MTRRFAAFAAWLNRLGGALTGDSPHSFASEYPWRGGCWCDRPEADHYVSGRLPELRVTAATAAVLWGVNLAAAAWFLYGPWEPAAGWFRFTAVTAAIGLASSLIAGYWAAAGFCAVTLALLLGDWWRRKGKSVARQLGAKSRALLAAVVAKAREAGTPLPEGVRA